MRQAKKWIIEVVDQGRPAYVCEREGELYLTWRRSEAAVYATELDAKCAKVYVADHHQPRLVTIGESDGPA